jgi:hypothetical protein
MAILFVDAESPYPVDARVCICVCAFAGGEIDREHHR